MNFQNEAKYRTIHENEFDLLLTILNLSLILTTGLNILSFITD